MIRVTEAMPDGKCRTVRTQLKYGLTMNSFYDPEIQIYGLTMNSFYDSEIQIYSSLIL